MHDHSSTNFVLITGASTGIGKACALYLDKKGVSVFAGIRKEEDGVILQKEASQGLQPLLLDVTNEASISSALERIEQTIPPTAFFGLVNNAGIAYGGPLEFLDTETFRKLLEVNLIGAVSVTKNFIPLVRKTKGRIVNISSISGRIALPFVGFYAASKFGLEAVSDSLRVELRPWKIPVSLIEPGDVATPIWEKTSNKFRNTENTIPKTARDIYGPIFKKIKQTEIHGIPPEKIAKKLEHALFHPKPKNRYLVGLDARILTIIAAFPVGIRDFIISLFLPGYGNQKAPFKK